MLAIHLLCLSLIVVFAHLSPAAADGVQCGQPERPVNGTVSPAGRSYFPGEKVTYSCLEGFVLFGTEGRTCLKNGTWSGSVPLCDFNLAKGKRTLQSDTLWSYVPSLAVDGNRNTCSFTPKGAESRWWQVHLGHKFNVVSIGVTISPGSFQEFTIYVIELLSNNKALYKPCTEFKGVFQTHKGLFKCNDGLGHPGQYVYVRDDRKEDQYFGLCEVEVFAFRERIPCGDPEIPLNGEVRREDENKAVYSCDEGHRLVGDTVITCSSKGEWQGQTPKCEEVKCGAPNPLQNGFIEISNRRGEYIFGTEAKYGCSPGYILQGVAARVCGPEGKWSEEDPSCQEVTCGDPPDFENAEYTFLNGSTSQWTGIVVYHCVDGFQMKSENEDSVTTCLDTGVWRSVNVSCIPFTNKLEFILRESEGRSLDYIIPKHSAESNSSHLVITLAVIAGILAAGMFIFGVLLLRRRFLSSSLGSLSPLVVRVHEPPNGTSSTKEMSRSNDEAEVPRTSPYSKMDQKSTQFHSNLLHSIVPHNLNHDSVPNNTKADCAADGQEEPAYEPVRSDHSYETLRKKRSLKNTDEEDNRSSPDSNYESVSSDKESVGYETVASPKETGFEPGYESIAGGIEPGYEVCGESKDAGYEVVKEKESKDKEQGYETLLQEQMEGVTESGYEIVHDDTKRIHGYETLKPKLPPRDSEDDSNSVPDILQHLSLDPESTYKLPADGIPQGATGEIPAEILALYAKVDRTKKNRKLMTHALPPSSPPIPANHPILDPKPSSRNLHVSAATLPKGNGNPGRVNSLKGPSKIGPKQKAKELIRKFNSLNSDEDLSEMRSISPPSSVGSEGFSNTNTFGGCLRPLPPLPK